MIAELPVIICFEEWHCSTSVLGELYPSGRSSYCIDIGALAAPSTEAVAALEMIGLA